MTQEEILAEILKLKKAEDKLSTSLKEKKDAREALELQLLALLDEQGTEQMRARGYVATITSQVVATVKEWEKTWAYIVRHKKDHLVQRRLNNAAWREETKLRKGRPIPGTEPFTKRTLSIRKASKT